jgi:hypothetical protein
LHDVEGEQRGSSGDEDREKNPEEGVKLHTRFDNRQ